jgi:hypothetical protein
MKPRTLINGNSVNSYVQLFDRALDNFALICQEYKDSPLCKKGDEDKILKSNQTK